MSHERECAASIHIIAVCMELLDRTSSENGKPSDIERPAYQLELRHAQVRC
jgi:hypothetical protein